MADQRADSGPEDPPVVGKIDKKTRSHLVARMRGKDTRPEKLVRSVVLAMGYRFWLLR